MPDGRRKRLNGATAVNHTLITRPLCRTFALLCLFVLTLTAVSGQAQPTPSRATSRAKLRAEMASIAAATRGPVGATVLIVEGDSIVALHGERRFPMQSVYKLPIAMATLHQVDLRTLSLNQPIRITSADFPPPSRGSPLRDKYPHGTTLTVAQLLDAMMSVSDGTASDVLLKRAGGPQRVTAYLRGLGVRSVVVATSEAAMAQNERVQYRNWATPDAMAGLLRVLQSGGGLSASSRHLLLGLMIASRTGPDRIKGRLPPGTVVAHKTGSSGAVNGVTRATNDAGLVTLPDGKHLAVVVFVSDTQAGETTQEAVIARIARVAWDRRGALEGKQ